MAIASETAIQQRCALCDGLLQEPMITDFDTQNRRLRCRACGTYVMTMDAIYTPLRGEDGNFWLGAATRQHWEIYEKPLLIRMADMEQLAAQHSKTSVSENIQNLLNYFVRKSSRPSVRVGLNTEYDFRVIDARDTRELEFYLQYLVDSGLIEIDDDGNHLQSLPTYFLTPAGWDNVLGTSASSAELGRVFVAMWFDESMSDAYEMGIKAALKGIGYLPVCMNETFQNDDINFAILAEIRRAQFVIADITGARGGVYFEAGFAKALGRDVFFTCQKDRFAADKHFDTEHFHHTTWETPADLAKSLQEKIMALKGPGPHRVTR
jgi:hypothetical protein